MKNNTVLEDKGGQAVISDEILKVTALLYFKEALVNQAYESCQELVDLAKGFGASKGEIKQVIAAVIRDKGSGQSGANRGKIRPRYS